ncbi:MAG: twin-arginine translocation signal domain-containing protein, partial [Armatimonadota bacterium]
MNRRDFAKLVAAGTSTVAVGSQASAQGRGRTEPERDRPNIIFIMADDLGQYDLGCCGQENILTPSIDRMAAE